MGAEGGLVMFMTIAASVAATKAASDVGVAFGVSVTTGEEGTSPFVKLTGNG